MSEVCFEKFSQRATKFLGVREISGRQWKMHSIVYGDGTFDETRFENGLQGAVRNVPAADEKEGRPNAGFVILHQGKTADYVVACWWDRENEMPVSVWARDNEGWQAARDGESFCVWDLEVMWKERCKYVETVMRGMTIVNYLAQ